MILDKTTALTKEDIVIVLCGVKYLVHVCLLDCYFYLFLHNLNESGTWF
jgi:hypothetical protein